MLYMAVLSCHRLCCRLIYRWHGSDCLWHLNICRKLHRICSNHLTQAGFHILYAVRESLLSVHDFLKILIKDIFLVFNDELIALLESGLKPLDRL